MIKRFCLLIAGVFFAGIAANAQTGTLKGKVTDAATGESVPFANIVLERNGGQVAGVTTDFDGVYTIKPVDPGTYTVKASFVGYQPVAITGVVIPGNKITFNDIELSSGVDIQEVKVISYKKPLLDKDNPTTKYTTSEEIKNMPTRNVSSVAATTAGVYKSDENSSINVKGSRSDATDYYVDGMKVRGDLGLPQSGIEQIMVITGGVPAEFGDATGGIISVTTKGPSSQFTAGAEYVTSALFDKYNYNLAAINMSGPIYKKINEDGSKGRSVLGYFLAGEARLIGDGDPSAIGMYKIKDDVLAELQANPFRVASVSQLGDIGLINNANYLTADDWEWIPNKINNGNQGFRVAGKLDFKPTMNLNMTIGGSYDYTISDNHNMDFSLLNYNNMSENATKNMRVFGRMTQKFGAQEEDDDESASTVKNAYYTLQADYSKINSTYGNPTHGTNIFDYGHVGTFTTYRDKFFIDSLVNGDPQQAIALHVANYDTLYTYSPETGHNPELANYTTSYFDLYQENIGTIRNQYDLMGLGLRNGDMPSSVYSLWSNNGVIDGWTSHSEATQFAVKAKGAADIGDHEISFGFEYENRDDRYWGVSATGLWDRMRQLANKHISELDSTAQYIYVDQLTGERLVSDVNPWDIAANYTFQDTIFYNNMYVESEHSFFDKNLREALMASGQAVNVMGEVLTSIDGTEWIDIDSFDPDVFSVDYFSADELLNEGNSYVYYYGYDHTGDRVEGKTFRDFFRPGTIDGASQEYTVDELMNRFIPSYQPIYIAGYIQDKFAIDDLIFNIGLRIDRFDANQQVLKDPFLFHNAYTAWDVVNNDEAKVAGLNATTPANIGDDFVVYVDDFEDPKEITGYRNGDIWYDSDGIEIADPDLIAEKSDGKIAPYLMDVTETREDRYKAFKDYEPELVMMPRISFSFPISDEAQFFAHYDVLTQRPPQRNRLDPTDYFFIENNVGGLLNNPDLKSEKTIDYELGFAQTLNLRSSLTLSAFYRELRDMIQVVNVAYAYPATYMTMGNVDFGTVKGFQASYDLRRTGNVSLTANYTLQFADGTGSSATSGFSLVNTGMPNLRTMTPMSYDQRHALSATVDYRYASGKEYNGPVVLGKQIFSNAGANFIVTTGSGTPYSRQSNITQEAASGINDRSILDGEMFGSRLPWSTRINSQISKRFDLEWDKKDGSKKRASLNMYLQIQNLLNTQNIMGVYRATGNPDDDGYLTDATAQSDIENKYDPQSFRDLYTIAVNNPHNYSMPRIMRLGVSLSF